MVCSPHADDLTCRSRRCTLTSCTAAQPSSFFSLHSSPSPNPRIAHPQSPSAQSPKTSRSGRSTLLHAEFDVASIRPLADAPPHEGYEYSTTLCSILCRKTPRPGVSSGQRLRCQLHHLAYKIYDVTRCTSSASIARLARPTTTSSRRVPWALPPRPDAPHDAILLADRFHLALHIEPARIPSRPVLENRKTRPQLQPHPPIRPVRSSRFAGLAARKARPNSAAGPSGMTTWRVGPPAPYPHDRRQHEQIAGLLDVLAHLGDMERALLSTRPAYGRFDLNIRILCPSGSAHAPAPTPTPSALGHSRSQIPARPPPRQTTAPVNIYVVTTSAPVGELKWVTQADGETRMIGAAFCFG